ncbi:MAG: hypothetical protein M1830_006841 [Pleopsidium flavum]|nr:MAG: hypothetical protein M1830_006841 [Pleopsidium flavum]
MDRIADDDFTICSEVRGDAITLKGVLEGEDYKGQKLMYNYDFGDHWDHLVELVGRAKEASDNVSCVEGEGHPVGEDVGGPRGWGGVQAAYLSPAAEGSEDLEDQEERIMWYEQYCLNGDENGLRG